MMATRCKVRLLMVANQLVSKPLASAVGEQSWQLRFGESPAQQDILEIIAELRLVVS